MSERERFEAWARTQPRHEGASMRFLPLNNAYIDFDLHGAWLAWQAARSGQAASGSQENARSDDQNGVGQPEAPTAAPLTDEQIEKIAYEVVPPYGAVPNRKRDCLLFARALLAAAHPPARSGAGSEEAQPDRSEP